MPAISLWAPWSSLMALGVKTIETRSWRAHRDVIGQRMAIAATGTMHVEAKDFLRDTSPGTDALAIFEALRANGHHIGWDRKKLVHDLPLGKILCTARLKVCVPMVAVAADEPEYLVVGDDTLTLVDRFGRHDVTDQRPFGAFAPGRWAWIFADLVDLDVKPEARGRQGIWTWRP